MKKIVLIIFCIVLISCVGSPVHQTIKYNSIQSAMERNNENLLLLKIGIDKVQTKKIMGNPEKSEGYEWGSAWLYRTSMTGEIYKTTDADYTPIVFDKNDKVIGWGRNFFVDQVKKYQVEIKK